MKRIYRGYEIVEVGGGFRVYWNGGTMPGGIPDFPTVKEAMEYIDALLA